MQRFTYKEGKPKIGTPTPCPLSVEPPRTGRRTKPPVCAGSGRKGGGHSGQQDAEGVQAAGGDADEEEQTRAQLPSMAF